MYSLFNIILSTLNEALSVLRTCIRKSTESEKSINSDLSKKDEELRKIQKNMSQWKVRCQVGIANTGGENKKNKIWIQIQIQQATARRLATKFEDELKRISAKSGSGLLTLGDVESGFESTK